MTLAFAGMYATGLLGTLVAWPLAVWAPPPPVVLGVGAAVLLATLALKVGIAAYALKRAVDGPPRPPWLLITVSAVLVVFTFPASMGASAMVAAAQARTMEVERFAEVAMGNAVLGAIGGGLHVVLLVGLAVAVAIGWQRALDAGE